MKHLTTKEVKTYLQANGSRYPVYHFTDKGVSTDIVKFEIVAAPLKFAASVDVRSADMCRQGDKGDYLCFNPTAGGFHFILPHDYFIDIWKPKKGNSILEIVRSTFKKD